MLASGKVNYWTGTEGREFEKEYARYVGTRHAVAVANGTLALELALKVLGIGPGDEVVITSRNIIASASCSVSSVPDRSLPKWIPKARTLRRNRSQGTESCTKAIVAVHLAGWPCEMDEILALARRSRLKVVEDLRRPMERPTKEGLSARWGTCRFFFCQDKIITTAGEGGMVTSNSDQMYLDAWG